MSNQEIITRRNLPHWYVPGAMHFVTYRLAGSIPQAVLHRLRETRFARLRQGPPEGVDMREHRERAHKQFFAEYDAYLDRTCKMDWLAQPALAALIRRNLHHHNGSKYHLLAYCIMPNHVHVVLRPIEPTSEPLLSTGDEDSDEKPDRDSPLASIMHSLKSYTAHEANKILQRSGQFWQHESYDHWVRDDDELARIVNYVAWNPVKAKLVDEPMQWLFGSAHDRFLFDGSKLGFLA